jgi:hypothetical protein
MKRISAGGAGGVRVRERGAGSGALSALPRLQLELTAFTRHTVCSVTPPPPELHAEGMGQGEDRPHHRGVGTSVAQRVLGVNSHDRSLRVGA